MIDLNNEFLQSIQDHRLSLGVSDASFYFPHYEGYSIANIPASIFQWLGIHLEGSRPLSNRLHQSLDQEFDHVILTIVDGLNYHLFEQLLSRVLKHGQFSLWAPIIDNAILATLTSVCPSTTAAALTTLWTGKQPAEHAVIGYEMWLKEYGVLANMITHSFAGNINEIGSIYKSGFEPDKFLSVPTIGPKLRRKKINAYAYQHESIYKSGLSTMLMQEVRNISYANFQDLWFSVDKNIRLSKDKTYSYIYWGDLDTLSHHVGPQDERVIQAWFSFCDLLGQFLNKMRTQPIGRTLFLLTADHGQIATEPNPIYDLKNHPYLTERLIMQPSGEGRIPYLFVHQDKAADITQYCAQTWPNQFQIMTKERFLDSKILGDFPPNPKTTERLGDFIVIPAENKYWWWANKENQLQGRHGGLQQDEMLVPFLACQL